MLLVTGVKRKKEKRERVFVDERVYYSNRNAIFVFVKEKGGAGWIGNGKKEKKTTTLPAPYW